MAEEPVAGDKIKGSSGETGKVRIVSLYCRVG